MEQDPSQYKTTGSAARVGDLIGLQHMVWDGRPIDVFDNRGWSPLHEAAHGGFSGCLEFLLRHPDADPNWQTFEGETAILLAARHGHYQCLRALTNAQADCNMATPEGFTPLYEAVHARSNECIRLLIKKGAEVNHSVYTGYTPLHEATSMGNSQITAYLLQQGARQDVRCSNGLTPLFVAVQSGSIDTVRCLLRHANARDDIDQDIINMAAEDNATPLLIAAQDGHADIIDLLLTQGADANIMVTEPVAGPLQFAIYSGHARCVYKLIPVTDMLPFESDYGLMHPLVQALKWPDTKILQYLLDADLDPHGARSLDAEQADVIRALGQELPEIVGKASLLCHVPKGIPLNGVRYLLKQGVSPDAVSRGGGHELSPLTAAMIHRDFPLFSLLIQYGAKPNIYYNYVDGNIAMLYALHFDLGSRMDTIADAGVQRGANGVLLPPSANACVREKNSNVGAWLEQCKNSYFLRLFAAGAEVESLLQKPGTANGSTWGLAAMLRFNLFFEEANTEEEMEKCNDQATALLALLVCLSYNVPHAFAPSSELLQLVSDDQAKALSSLAERSTTLAHLTRLNIIRRQCCREGKLEDWVASLGVPLTVCEYLLFPELSRYCDTLKELLPPKERS